MPASASHVKEDHRKPIYSVVANGDSDVFATAGSNTISVYRSLSDGSLDLLQSYLDENEDEMYYSCCWSESEEGDPLLAVAGARGMIKVINTRLQTTVDVLQGHGGDINFIDTYPNDRNLIFSVSKDESIRLWNIRRSICIAVFAGSKGHCGDVLHMAINTAGDRFCSCGMDSCIKVWELGDEVQKAIAESYCHDPNTATRQFKTRMVQNPVFSTNRFHMNYVDCVAYFGDLVLSKSVHNSILMWQPLVEHPKQSMCEEMSVCEFTYKAGWTLSQHTLILQNAKESMLTA